MPSWWDTGRPSTAVRCGPLCLRQVHTLSSARIAEQFGVRFESCTPGQLDGVMARQQLDQQVYRCAARVRPWKPIEQSLWVLSNTMHSVGVLRRLPSVIHCTN